MAKLIYNNIEIADVTYSSGGGALRGDVQDGSTVLSGLITIRYTKREEES